GASGVLPTPRAEALWPEVRAALQQLRGAFEPSVYDPATQPQSFRLAMADATAAQLLPPLLEQLQRQAALAELRVLPLLTRDPTPLLERGETELAIGHFPELVSHQISQGAHAPLRYQYLYESEYVCVMRRDHPLAEAELTLDTYCAAAHLLVSFSGRPQGLVDEALARLQRKRRIVLAVNQFFTAGRVVTCTDLLTVLPRAFLATTGAAEQLICRPLPLPLAPLQIHLVWHRRHDPLPAQRWLRERITEVARQAGS
ncbi:MAG: hypothetical protein RJA44_677, partial [Pseudomonadota bacterium]